MIELKNNSDAISEVKKFLVFCHDTLRDKEGITNMDALSNISMLLFLKFVNNSVKSGDIDLLKIEKYRNESGNIDDKFNKYKDYVKFCVFENIIEKGKFKVDVPEIPQIIEFIFKHVLWYHPNTKDIFQDRFPSIKNELTYEQIFKRIDKIEWETLDIDIKGVAYEHFLKSEMGGGDLGQFFTRREVIDYMINNVKSYITKESTVFDPFMGTGGFLTRMLSEIKKLYVVSNTSFTDKIKSDIVNGIEKNPQTSMLALNNLLLTMDTYPSNVKCDDSLRNYIDKKYSFVLTNPPFGIKGLTYDEQSMFPDYFNGIKKTEYLPYKSNDAICLALQAIHFILKDDGVGAIVVPYGKQITSEKEKSLVNTRKLIIEKANLFQVTILSSGTFLPYTGVETVILFFKKGEITKNIKFVKLDSDYKTEKQLSIIDIDKIRKSNYSLNYKVYQNLNNNEYMNLKYVSFEDVFSLIKGKIQSSSIKSVLIGDGKFINKGEYILWQTIDIKQCDTFGKNLFFGTSFNGNGKMPIRYYDGPCTYSNLISHVKILKNYENDINIKFYYYYFCTIQKQLEEEYNKGACNKSLDLNLINKIQIPVPSIETQNIIVNELDTLYAEKEALQTAVNKGVVSHKATFELLLDDCKDKKEVKLSDVCESIKTGKIKPSDCVDKGKKYPYYGTGGITGYTDEYIVDGEYILTPRNGTIGVMFLCTGKSYPSDHMYIIKSIGDLNIKYLNYALTYNNLSYHKTGATIPNITIEILEKYTLYVPSVANQEKIIHQMQKLDDLKQMQQSQIKYIDELINKRFNYHLKKCEMQNINNNIKNDQINQIDQIDKNIDEQIIEPIKKKIIKKVIVKVIKQKTSISN